MPKLLLPILYLLNIMMHIEVRGSTEVSLSSTPSYYFDNLASRDCIDLEYLLQSAPNSSLRDTVQTAMNTLGTNLHGARKAYLIFIATYCMNVTDNKTCEECLLKGLEPGFYDNDCKYRNKRLYEQTRACLQNYTNPRYRLTRQVITGKSVSLDLYDVITTECDFEFEYHRVNPCMNITLPFSSVVLQTQLFEDVLSLHLAFLFDTYRIQVYGRNTTDMTCIPRPDYSHPTVSHYKADEMCMTFFNTRTVPDYRDFVMGQVKPIIRERLHGWDAMRADMCNKSQECQECFQPADITYLFHRYNWDRNNTRALDNLTKAVDIVKKCYETHTLETAYENIPNLNGSNQLTKNEIFGKYFHLKHYDKTRNYTFPVKSSVPQIQEIYDWIGQNLDAFIIYVSRHKISSRSVQYARLSEVFCGYWATMKAGETDMTSNIPLSDPLNRLYNFLKRLTQC